MEGRGLLVNRHWQPQFAGIGGRRAREGFAYEAYVPNLISDEDLVITTHAATAAANAEAATRELNDDPPAAQNLEALARQLLRAESVASSRIEGLILSHRRLARAALAPDRDLNAASVLGNIAALERALEFASDADDLTTRQIVEIHRTLFEGTRDAHLGGVIRNEQNWIGGDASSPRNAEFIPPPHEYVPALLEDLAQFLNREDVPAVIQAAVAHAQFETIHPFVDGNGRVGRAIILAVLRRRGIAPFYLPPVSLALAGRADRYIAGLTSWRFGDTAEDWLLVFGDAVWRAATGAQTFAAAVTNLQLDWADKAANPRQGSAPRRLIELLPSHPVVRVADSAELLGITNEAARQAILRLEGAGVLRQVTLGKRNRAWETVGLFDLLDRFERDLGPAERTPRPTQNQAAAR
jgi:Fic family protein